MLVDANPLGDGKFGPSVQRAGSSSAFRIFKRGQTPSKSLGFQSTAALEGN